MGELLNYIYQNAKSVRLIAMCKRCFTRPKIRFSALQHLIYVQRAFWAQLVETLAEVPFKTLYNYIVFHIATAPEKMVYASSHPDEDVNGNVYNIMTSLGIGMRHNIVQIPRPLEGENQMKKGKSLEGAKVVASIRLHNPFVYYHSFGLTPNYFIFVENPFIISPFRLLTKKILQRSVYECMYWDAKEPSRFYLIDRKSGSCVATYETHNFFTFHHVNAYEDGHEVVVDLCCYPDSTIIDKYYLYNLRNSKPEEVRYI